MNTYTLEIAAFTLQGALIAEEAGADRIEFCENPYDGGTTPSYGLLRMIQDKIKIPVYPIIRPRGGDFVYSDLEFEAMKEDIAMCKQLDFKGVVTGILDNHGNVDVKRSAELVLWAKPMKITFHRAFDRTRNPMEALEDIIQCGYDRILTSGQYPSVFDGMQLVKDLVEQAGKRIIIMPGSGLNSNNVKEIATNTGAKEFHTAARMTEYSQRHFTSLTMNEKLSYVSVNAQEVKNIKAELDKLS